MQLQVLVHYVYGGKWINLYPEKMDKNFCYEFKPLVSYESKY